MSACEEGGGERERARLETKKERETVESRSTWQAVLCVASNKMDSENNESGRERLFNNASPVCVSVCETAQ